MIHQCYIYSLTLLCISVILVSSCGGTGESAAQPDTQAGIVLRHITDGTSDIEYPVIMGLADETVEASINGAIHDLIFVFADTTTAGFEHTDRSADPRDPQLEIWVENLIGVNAGGILSMEFTLTWYAGGAHPMSYLRSLTFDLTTGKELALSDLFAEDSGYVEGISSVVRDGFAQSEMPLLEEFVRIDPDNEYYLSAEGIVVYFQRYEYTPYAYGFPHFTVPYEQAEMFGLSYDAVINLSRSFTEKYDIPFMH